MRIGREQAELAGDDIAADERDKDRVLTSEPRSQRLPRAGLHHAGTAEVQHPYHGVGGDDRRRDLSECRLDCQTRTVRARTAGSVAAAVSELSSALTSS